MIHMTKATKTRKWLDSCPHPIVARVVTEPEDLLHIANTTMCYEENTLVAVPIESLHNLVALLKKEQNDGSI